MPRKSTAPAHAPIVTDGAIAGSTPPATASRALAKPASTTDFFRKPKDDKRGPLTHEKIADDLKAFQRAGGRIEVLGNTQMLKSIRPPEAPEAAQKGRERKQAAKPAR